MQKSASIDLVNYRGSNIEFNMIKEVYKCAGKKAAQTLDFQHKSYPTSEARPRNRSTSPQEADFAASCHFNQTIKFLQVQSSLGNPEIP